MLSILRPSRLKIAHRTGRNQKLPVCVKKWEQIIHKVGPQMYSQQQWERHQTLPWTGMVIKYHSCSVYSWFRNLILRIPGIWNDHSSACCVNLNMVSFHLKWMCIKKCTWCRYPPQYVHVYIICMLVAGGRQV